MDSLSLAMMHFEPPRQLARTDSDRVDFYRMLHMGSELDWPVLAPSTYANRGAGWAERNHALDEAQAGLASVWSRLWGPWYGQRPEMVRQRKRDALGEVIQLADERRN